MQRLPSQVDFKVSAGFASRVLVEPKVSTNLRLTSGYEKQIEPYRGAEETKKAIYLAVDIGGMDTRYDRLLRAKNSAAADGPVSQIELVDGQRRDSASRR